MPYTLFGCQTYLRFPGQLNDEVAAARDAADLSLRGVDVTFAIGYDPNRDETTIHVALEVERWGAPLIDELLARLSELADLAPTGGVLEACRDGETQFELIGRSAAADQAYAQFAADHLDRVLWSLGVEDEQIAAERARLNACFGGATRPSF